MSHNRGLLLCVAAIVTAALLTLLAASTALAAASITPSGPKPMTVPESPKCLNDLIEGSLAYDGRQITVKGEVIGDIMPRGDFTWINIYDGTATIGVWGPASLIGQVKKTGRYKSYGDIVRVTGLFRRDDARQGGELDIQATSIEIMKPGRIHVHPITPRRLLRTGLSLALALTLGAAWYLTRPARVAKTS